MTAHFSDAAASAFELFFRPWMRSRIRAVLLTGLPRDLGRDRSILLAANHISWWDGFILRELQRKLRPGAPFHSVMTAEELRRLPFLKPLGAVGINRDSPTSIARAVRDLRAVVALRPEAVVAFFPQGRIWPVYRRPLEFERGVEFFCRHLRPIVLPVALHFEPLNHPSPTCFVAVGEPIDGEVKAEWIEERVAAALDALLAFLAREGEDAPAHWPGPWGSLPRGGRRMTGVS